MPFLIQLHVAPSDVDELEHVNNAVYVRWAQEAAVAHSIAVGLGLAEYRAGGAAFVVRRHEIDYLRPALGGDAISVETRVAALTTITAERTTAIRRGDELLARAATLWAYVDLATGRPIRIPDDVRGRFPVEPDESLRLRRRSL